MKLDTIINKKISKYNPKGGLDQTAKFFLAIAEINHKSTKSHVQRVALLAEATSIELKKDSKAAFFGGLLHDIGKIILPSNLFDGHNISSEEYSEVKKHAQDGFKALMKLHMFTALCAGFHHNLYQSGYGVSINDFPNKWSNATIKKVLDISMIISICDFVDAYTNRTTKILDGSGSESNLKSMLENKYPNEHMIIDIVLKQSLNLKGLK